MKTSQKSVFDPRQAHIFASIAAPWGTYLISVKHLGGIYKILGVLKNIEFWLKIQKVS
jgi:hypothetical protein